MAYLYGPQAGEHAISFAFASVDVGSGTNYAGGFYMHGATDNDFNPAVNLGTADSAHGAHVYLVQVVGAGGGDTTVQIGGTSWDSTTGTRSAADTEDIVIDDAAAAGTFYQSDKMWIGQVSLTKTAGPDLLCNYGFVNIWHHSLTDWYLCGFEVTWQGDGNDAGTNIQIIHHSPAGWTYNAGAPATPPVIYDMQTDYNTEYESNNDEYGSYMRSGTNLLIEASLHRGVIVAGIQTGSVPFGVGNASLCVRPA